MRFIIPILIVVILAIAGCTERIDYDIEDVAPAEHLSGEEEHLYIHAGVHMHESGVRNHGTEWFFNKPWAASFVWGKMLRDTIVLLLLATGLFLIPRIRSRWRR